MTCHLSNFIKDNKKYVVCFTHNPTTKVTRKKGPQVVFAKKTHFQLFLI